MVVVPSYGEAGLQRRALFGLLPDDSSSTSSTATDAAVAAAAAPTTTESTTSTGGGGGLLGGLTSAIGDVSSAIGGLVPGQTSTSSSTSSSSSLSSTSLPSTTSTVSSTSSLSTASATTSSSTTTTSSAASTSETSTTSASQTTPEPVAQSQATTTYVSTSDNQVYTVTQTLIAGDASSASPSETATRNGASSKSFLENKPLSGTVFALVGLVGLVLIVVISTYFIRRSRRNRLERDAELFANDTWPSAGADAFATNGKGGLVRTPSDRTARSDGTLTGGGGYGHRQQLSDGTLRQSPPPQMQMQQVPSGGMGMNGFNQRPVPPGLSGTSGGAWGQAPPPVQQQTYGYESAYPAYQQTTYMPPSQAMVQQQQQQQPQRAPTNGSVQSGSTFGQPQPQQFDQMSAMPQPRVQQQGQDVQHNSGRSGPSPPVTQSEASVSGHKASGFGSGSGADLTASNGNGTRQVADIRASTGSDAYADYAFATGPGQQGSHPRNLTIANA